MNVGVAVCGATPQAGRTRLASLGSARLTHGTRMETGVNPPRLSVCFEYLVRAAVMVGFVALVAQFWHPYFGFTKFLQMDAPVAPLMAPVLRGTPIYTYANDSGYDGHYYGRIASDPSLRQEGMGGAMDNFAYRARRILTPALAHALALGDPVRSVWIYSGLNLAAWFALAVLFWVLLPTGDFRRTAAWVGLLFCVGALHSVRFALADLPALAWFAGGWLAWERRRLGWAAALFAASALSRETMALALGVVALLTWRRDGFRPAFLLGAVSVAPLALWLGYIGLRLGLRDGGWDNFEWPGWGFAWKWSEAIVGLTEERNRVLTITTPLGTIALTAQILYFALRRHYTPEWWLGVVFAAMALTLNVAVWEGHPGAAPRVLLPLSFAFWLCVARERAAWPWTVAGWLALPAGLICLWWVPAELRDHDAGRVGDVRYLVEVDRNFFPTEHNRTGPWAWSSGQGEVTIRTWPHVEGDRALELQCFGRTPRTIEIWSGERLLWRGDVGTKRFAVELPAVRFTGGRAVLRVRSDGATVREPGTGGRELSFAVSRVTLR